MKQQFGREFVKWLTFRGCFSFCKLPELNGKSIRNVYWWGTDWSNWNGWTKSHREYRSEIIEIYYQWTVLLRFNHDRVEWPRTTGKNNRGMEKVDHMYVPGNCLFVHSFIAKTDEYLNIHMINFSSPSFPVFVWLTFCCCCGCLLVLQILQSPQSSSCLCLACSSGSVLRLKLNRINYREFSSPSTILPPTHSHRVIVQQHSTIDRDSECSNQVVFCGRREITQLFLT